MNILNLIVMRPRKMGTVEDFCLMLSDTLTTRGDRAVFAFAELPPPWLQARFDAVGAFLEVVDYSAPTSAQCRRVIDLVRTHRIDLVHLTFASLYSPLLPSIKWLGGVPKVVFSDQSSRATNAKQTCWDPVMRQLKRVRSLAAMHFVDSVIADAEFIRADLIREAFVPPHKLRVIYNGANLGRFRPGNRAAARQAHIGCDEYRSVITTVANCISEKGLDVFLRAARLVVARDPYALFCIVGDGPLLQELKHLATSLGIESSVRFLGLRNDVESILQATDVFVLCSLWQEAFAFSLLEAMASGCPIVASRIGAIPESVLDGTTGFLVEPGNAEQTASAISRLLEDSSLRERMSQAARSRVESHFGMDRWVSQTIALYGELLSR
jgi:L-malate glycosyltransferase